MQAAQGVCASGAATITSGSVKLICVAAVLVTAATAGCGGGENEDRPTPREPVPRAPMRPYVAAVRAGYVPFRAAFVQAFEACASGARARRCGERNAALSRTGKRLLERLARVPAPPRLQAADVQLKRAVRSLVEFADVQAKCLAEGEEGCPASDGDEYRVAEEDLGNWVREINARAPAAKLPTPRP